MECPELKRPSSRPCAKTEEEDEPCKEKRCKTPLHESEKDICDEVDACQEKRCKTPLCESRKDNRGEAGARKENRPKTPLRKCHKDTDEVAETCKGKCNKTSLYENCKDTYDKNRFTLHTIFCLTCFGIAVIMTKLLSKHSTNS